MSIRLNVPLVSQRMAMSCWYASACMVAYYRAPGPRLGLPGAYRANIGVMAQDFIRLAAAEGLRSLQAPEFLTENQLETYLRNFGPIWCAGYWDGVGHVVVLTGVQDGIVYINDPNPAVGQREESMAWFNLKRAKLPSAMMYMPG